MFGVEAEAEDFDCILYCDGDGVEEEGRNGVFAVFLSKIMRHDLEEDIQKL